MPRKKETTRKTVFFIVEGNTDKTALEKIFKTIYKKRDIRFEFTNGDITSDDLIDKINMCEIIYKKVEKYMNENKLKKTDIWKIVQIFDTDGTYIPETAIFKGKSSEFVYSTTGIECKDVMKVKNRNSRKRDKMDYLLSLSDIKGIPFQCYFMSCNLDHALYNQQNLIDEDKRKYADAFYEKFIGIEKYFIDFLKIDVVNGVPDSFPASWRYIKEDSHSLERHTNLHIYFMENPYE
ncbi:hypothetical protein [Anaerosporobacter sp.]|uniref:hypothetical protein n=1 Tax=Anaerosporobacter sp. TaxID=1872529 RepID=UPI00286EBBB9|nr:hypothetical protein [Anaerosporobacter sp.]